MKSHFFKVAAIAALSLSAIASCQKAGADNSSTTNAPTEINMTTPDTISAKVLVNTNMGSFTVLLYGDTPKHRDNFLRLAKEGYYDGTLFHRVIKDFMIQAGDPDSKNAAPEAHLGAGGPNYKIDAEIVFPKHFHKRGALAAARQGDQVNPMKQSSGSQFYIVTGNVFGQADLGRIERQLQGAKTQQIFNELSLANRDSIIEMQRKGDRNGLTALRDSLIKQTEDAVAKLPSQLTQEMKEAYTTVGGAPHLDGQYTVFGEIIDGMDVVDKIEKVETGSADRPKEDVKIISMKVLAE